jgi:hypothetical protein
MIAAQGRNDVEFEVLNLMTLGTKLSPCHFKVGLSGIFTIALIAI